MIPYFEIPPLHIGPLSFHAFGALVALGFIVGTKLAARYARALRLDENTVYDLSLLCIIFGIVGAHLFHVFAYEPHRLKTEPLFLLQFWSGLSSYGGIIGATTAVCVFLKRKGLKILPYTDTLVYGLMAGWFLGRVGCFTAHDHPGKLTQFWGAVRFPSGARHDLGLYEAVVLLVIFGILWLASGKAKKYFLFPGGLLGLGMILYSPVRLFMDTLRATDVAKPDARYFGYTPAQYVSAAILMFGLYILFYGYQKRSQKV